MSRATSSSTSAAPRFSTALAHRHVPLHGGRLIDLAGSDRTTGDEHHLERPELDPGRTSSTPASRLPDLDSSNVVEVVANCAYMTTRRGPPPLHRPGGRRGDTSTPSSRVADARRVACFEQPDLKATWKLTVEGPSPLDRDIQLDDPEPTDVRVSASGSSRRKPISTYITALVAGPVPRGARRVLRLLRRLSTRRVLPQSRWRACHLDVEDILLIHGGVQVLRHNFRMPYAFGKLRPVVRPEFNAGAMENAGCVTFARTTSSARG